MNDRDLRELYERLHRPMTKAEAACLAVRHLGPLAGEVLRLRAELRILRNVEEGYRRELVTRCEPVVIQVNPDAFDAFARSLRGKKEGP